MTTNMWYTLEKGLKRLHIGLYEIAALAIMALNACMRLALIAQNWPWLNSDESTMGLMALHIAYKGEHPVFFYGQGAMGSLEAYVGAIFFLLSGPSLLALRLGMIFLFTLFLISMYLLTSTLYNKNLALVTLVFLSLGPPEVLYRELAVLGGHPDTPLFGSVLLLGATWLALTCNSDAPSHIRRRRVFFYGVLAGVAGLALWNDPLSAPFVFVAALLLLFCCRSELRRAVWLSTSIGFLIGNLPTIMYNVTVLLHFRPSTQSSFFIFGFLFLYGKQPPPHSLFDKLGATLLVSLPGITGGNSVCTLFYKDMWPLSSQSSPHVLQCTAVHGIWGAVLILLWLIAVVLEVRRLRLIWSSPSLPERTATHRTARVISFARLLLLTSAGMTVLVYALSASAVTAPSPNQRYLIAIVVATPSVLFPLWDVARAASSKRLILGFTLVRAAMLIFVFGAITYGTVMTFSQIPANEVQNQQQQQLARDLAQLGAQHIYTDYWTCDLVVFLSREKIICAVLDEHLQPSVDRYLPYKTIVDNDPRAWYVFPVNSPQAIAFAGRIAQSNLHYQHTVIDRYVVYRPEETGVHQKRIILATLGGEATGTNERVFPVLIN